jgi:hypothetical protein
MLKTDKGNILISILIVSTVIGTIGGYIFYRNKTFPPTLNPIGERTTPLTISPNLKEDSNYIPGDVIIGLTDKATLNDLDNFVKDNPIVSYKKGYNPPSFFKTSLEFYSTWQEKVKAYSTTPNYQLSEEIRVGKEKLKQVHDQLRTEPSIGIYSEIKEYYQNFPFIQADIKEGFTKDDVIKLLEKYPDLELIEYFQVTSRYLLRVPSGEENIWIERLQKQPFISYAEKNYKAIITN